MIPLTLHKTTDKRYIVKLDASLYSQSACARRMYYLGARGLVYDTKSYKMEYGTAFHKALQEYYTTGDTKKAIAVALEHYCQPDNIVPDSDFRDAGHLAATLHQYFTNYEKLDGLKADIGDDGPLLEQRFAIPYDTDGERIDVVLCGTIDMIGTFNGMPVLVDHKTTSLTAVDRYLDSYYNSPQMMMYTMIYKHLFPDEDRAVVINGIFLSRSGRNKFQRSTLITFPQHVLVEFEHHVRETVVAFMSGLRRVIDYSEEEEQVFLPNFTCCQTKFGECNFAPVCTTPRADDRETLINTLFSTTNTYDPLNFQK